MKLQRNLVGIKDVPITLGANIASLRAQRELARGTDAIARVYERLASGQRITRASDDAASLGLAQSLNSDARVYAQAIRNVSDGISLLNIAEGALNALTTITLRQKELAEQAANGTYTLQQRRAMNKETDELVKEYNRIVATTKFNGLSLLDLSLGNISIQAGKSGSEAISFSIGDEIGRAVYNGGAGNSAIYTAAGASYDLDFGDLNGDGFADLAVANNSTANVSIFLNNGNGTFKSSAAYTTGTNPTELEIADLNNDGANDLVITDRGSDKISILLGNGNGTFKARVSYDVSTDPVGVGVADLNGDNILDLVQTNGTETSIKVLIGNGNGTFKSAVSYTTGTTPTGTPVIGDLNGDSINDIIVVDYGSDTLSVLLGNGNGTFKGRAVYATGTNPAHITSGDYNRDGILDVAYNHIGSSYVGVRLGRGDGTFGAETTLAFTATGNDIKTYDRNGDGYADLFVSSGSANTIFYGNGDGTFARGSLGGGLAYLATGDLNGDGVDDLAAGTGTASVVVSLLNTTQTSSLAFYSILIASEARTALTDLDQVLTNLSAELGSIGAAQRRLEIASSNLQSTVQNYYAAASRILDADVAQEAAELTRRKILQNTGIAILAQANQQPSIALTLIV